MTITGAALDSLSSTLDSSSPYAVTSPSTPTAGRVVWAAVGNTVASGTAPLPTFAGYGVTWVQVDTVTFNTNLKRITLFVGFNAGYTNAAPTATITGTPTGCLIKTAETDLTDTTTPTLQSSNDTGTGTTIASNLTTPTKACIIVAGITDNANPAVEAGWGSLGAGNFSTPALGILLALSTAADATPTATQVSSTAWGAIAAEINELASVFLSTQLESSNRGVDRGVSRGVAR